MENVSHSDDSQNNLWETDVQTNLVFLTQNITNLEEILIFLMQYGIISKNEQEAISAKVTTLEKNSELLTLLKRKGWPKVKYDFLDILTKTGNVDCVDKILGLATNSEEELTTTRTVLKNKWWPEEKNLPNSFYARKVGDSLLTDKLKEMLSESENKRTVINQKITVSGLGGIGKTTTAKGFALKYQDEYDHILWIDCGEGSLTKSFQKLDRDLHGNDGRYMELEELAKHCFNKLMHSKCLFIFDNAECYKGKEGMGIQKVLPYRDCPNFYTIITSRSREWGNENGDGLIPEFQLNVFSTQEGVEFLRNNINRLSEDDESNLEILCDEVGNLPLALQIAVATLNQSHNNQSLRSYIESLRNTNIILDSDFDDYEKTINATMSISLENITKDKRNKKDLASSILEIFGCIAPDGITVDFFIALQKINCGRMLWSETAAKFEVENAINLLASYSLITTKTECNGNYCLSIHRLLQQVVRQNTFAQGKKDALLRQIFYCPGFLEYKLIPFSYADDKLQNQFPKIGVELIQKLELKKLLEEKRYEDAVKLACVIKTSVNTPHNMYDYALCLIYNSEFQSAERILDSLCSLLSYSKFVPYRDLLDTIKAFYHVLDLRSLGVLMPGNTLHCFGKPIFNSNGIKYSLPLLESAVRRLALGEMFLLNLSQNEMEKAKKIATKTEYFLFNYTVEFLNKLILHLNKITVKDCFHIYVYPIYESYIFSPYTYGYFKIVFYSRIDDCHLQNNLYRLNCMAVELMPAIDLHLHKLVLNDLSINMSDTFTVSEVHLTRVKILDCENAKWQISKLCLRDMDFVEPNKLEIAELKMMGSMLKRKRNIVDVSCLPQSIISLDLNRYELMLTPNVRISPTYLSMSSVNLVNEEKQKISSICANDFINFQALKTVHLSFINGLSIDLSKHLALDEVYLSDVKLVNSDNIQWKAKKMYYGNSFLSRWGLWK